MSPLRAPAALAYRRVGRADLACVLSLELDPEQVERFLGPIPDILAAVQGGLTHSLTALHAADGMVGFYVLHRDRRAGDCWWLGWFAMDRRQQGRGYGRLALRAILAAFRRIPGCRRARLLVAPDNAPALRLYRAAGFRDAGVHGTGELVLELAMACGAPEEGELSELVPMPPARARRSRRGPRVEPGPHVARTVGATRGPPYGVRALATQSMAQARASASLANRKTPCWRLPRST